MGSSIDKAVKGAQAALRRADDRAVTYRRPSSGDSIDLKVVKGNTRFQANDVDGLTTDFEVEDFLIDVPALTFDGVKAKPQAGDRVEEGDLVYEVMAPGGSEPAWRFLDASHTTYRIHTKLIDDGS